MVVWPAATLEDITADSLSPVHDIEESVDLLIVGCGPDFAPEPAGLRSALKAKDLSLEWMDTGAACRTYNVLAGEERRVAAALIAV